MYTNILISTDGSELAQNGVDHGLSLAKALGSKVTVITVTESFPTAAMGGYDGWVATETDLKRFEEGNRQRAETILAATKAAADKIGLSITTLHVASARPAPAIVDTAETTGCNLIVMASHGHRGLKRMLLGSQTSEVLAHSTIPVLVVR